MPIEIGEHDALPTLPMWKKYITRRLAVQVAQMWNTAWGDAMKPVYGTSLRNTLVFRDSAKTDYYVDVEQHEHYVRDLHVLLKRSSFLKNFHRDAQHTLERIFEEVRELIVHDLAALSNRELLALYRDQIIPRMTQFYIRMWTVFNIGDSVLSAVMDAELKKSIPDTKRRNDILLSLSSPVEPNDVLRERLELLMLARDHSRISQKQFQKRLRVHAERYRHIPMFDFDHEPYDETHFLKELRTIRNPERELNKLRGQFRKKRKECNVVASSILPNARFTLLIDFLKQNVFLRDHRDMIRQKMNYELRRLYSEIARRLGADLQGVATLTNKEICAYLKNGKRFPQSELKKRERTYLLIQKGSRVSIYSGNDAIRRARKELGAHRDRRVQTLSGTVGSSGVASGRVSVVFTNRDLAKVRKGDVIVAPMTRQDFVPALRKAAALITDEGSVTCHAAIIARELGIPCIVATKTATQLFKDGDRVEVDAEKGIVKKLT